MRRVLTSPVAGLVPLTLFAAWALVSHPGAPESRAWAISCGVLGGGLLVGAVVGRVDPALAGLLALVIAVGSVLATAPASFSGLPTAPPLGYMNANGALVLAGAAGGVVATSRRPVSWQLGAAGVALVLTWVCLAGGAQAAAVACLCVAVWAVLRGRGPASFWVLAGVGSVVAPVGTTVLWASGVLGRPAALVAALSEERFSLWSEAWALLRAHPVSGVGPGRFSQQAPTAADPDLAWAHSAFLQTGAELGWVGIGLFALVCAWALVALGRDGVLLGLLLLPASIDYVLHFGGVLLVSSLVVGGAVASSSRAAGTGKPWLTPPSP